VNIIAVKDWNKRTIDWNY